MISGPAFARLLKQCLSRPPKRLTVALSGGADSMCLAFLLAQYSRAHCPGLALSAVTVDHGYRPEAAAEAAQVGEIVKNWGYSHSVVRLAYSQNPHTLTNFEEVARLLRYVALRDECLRNRSQALLVAHNLDDQIETFLQRLQMNSTLFGLVGLRQLAPVPVLPTGPHSQSLRMLRPLLPFSKREITATCVENGVPWFEDASNADISLTKRNLLRYLIGEYVPATINQRPEFACLSKENLLDSIDAVSATCQKFRSKAQNFADELTVEGVYIQNPAIIFTISRERLKDLGEEAFSQWLFQKIHKLSSSKHFHWSYAKIERGCVPRIFAFAGQVKADGISGLKMTYLNVLFDIKGDVETLYFRLSPQPPQREKLGPEYCLSVSDSSWILFDNLWWVKVTGHFHTTQIRYVSSNELTFAFPDYFTEEKKLQQKKLPASVPAVLAKDGRILASPGFSQEDVSVDWQLKTFPD